MDVSFELEAFAKVILHATKYPSFAVNGVLLRKITVSKAEEREGEAVHCEDAIPLTHIHMSKYCTPTMEIALSQAEQYCKDTKSEIVGYYQANQSINTASPDFIVTRIAEKLHEGNSRLIVVMVNNKELNSNLEKAPFEVYRFVDGKLKVQDVRVHLVPDDQGSLSTVSALIQAKAYRELVDFDNHLDNLKENYWTNAKVSETIQQFNNA